MAEIHVKDHTQLVGQSDARLNRDVKQSDEVMLNAEQQQIADVLQEQGKKLEKKVLTTRKDAGEKLKGLHGKELVKAGFKQVALGLGIGWGSELVGASIAATVPAGISALKNIAMLDPADNVSPFEFFKMDEAQGWAAMSAEVNLNKANRTEFFNTVKSDASKAWKYGGIAGSEASGWVYNVLTKEKNMPPVKWYDWVAGHLGFIPLKVNIGKIALNLNPINAITFSGFRHVATGMYEMGKIK